MRREVKDVNAVARVYIKFIQIVPFFGTKALQNFPFSFTVTWGQYHKRP